MSVLNSVTVEHLLPELQDDLIEVHQIDTEYLVDPVWHYDPDTCQTILPLMMTIGERIFTYDVKLNCEVTRENLKSVVNLVKMSMRKVEEHIVAKYGDAEATVNDPVSG